MEGQGKRILIAVVIAFGIMLLWNVIFPPEKKKKDEKQTDEVAQTSSASSGQGAGATSTAGGNNSVTNAGDPEAPSAGNVDVIERGAEEKVAFDFPHVHAEFSTYNGALVSWRLKKRTFTDDAGKPLDFVPIEQDPRFGQFQLDFTDGSTGLSPSSVSLKQSRQTEWTVAAKGPTHVEFLLKPAYAPQLQVRKRFTIDEETLSLRLDVSIKNISDGEIDQRLAIDMYGYQDPEAAASTSFGMPPRVWASACSKQGWVGQRKIGQLEQGPGEVSGAVHWGGFNHSYFLIAAAPSATPVVCQTFKADKPGAMRTRLILPATTINPQAPIDRTIVAYLGPKYLSDLEQLDAKYSGDKSISQSPDFASSVDLGMLSFIARPLLWMLVKYHGLVGNWGLAIILLTFTVKLLTLYFHTKSMRSMRAMSRLKPEIEAIKKKHKDDPKAAQAAQMALFKSHGVNPLAGCLPMVLQMPIWFALYRMLMRAGELYQAEFLWMKDLTTTDPLYILPVMVMIAMFVQSRLSPTNPDGMQQKIMMYGLPLIFGAFSFVLPAGLVLYMFTNTVLTAVHSLWMYRTEPKDDISKPAVKDDAPAKSTKDKGDKSARPSGRKKK